MQQMMSVKRGKERERESDRWMCRVVSKCEVCVCDLCCVQRINSIGILEREREREGAHAFVHALARVSI